MTFPPKIFSTASFRKSFIKLIGRNDVYENLVWFHLMATAFGQTLSSAKRLAEEKFAEDVEQIIWNAFKQIEFIDVFFSV